MTNIAQSPIEGRVINLVDRRYNRHRVQILRSTSLCSDLRFDSLLWAELVMDLESEFEIDISDLELEAMDTVAEVARLVEEKKACP